MRRQHQLHCVMTFALVLACGWSVCAAGQSPPALRLLFWQPSDICDGRNIRFEAHPFPDGARRVLLEAEPDRESLWYMPTDVVHVPEGLRVYYQRVEKALPEYADQRTWCVGVLKGASFERPDLGLHSQSWGGPANVVLRRAPHRPTWGGFNVFQVVDNAARGFDLLYWDQPAGGQAGAMLASSPDGFHWTKSGQGTVFTEHNDAYTLLREHGANRYLLYQTRLEPWPDKPWRDNLPAQRRVISLRRSGDLTHWSDQETILRPDRQDGPHTEFYLMKVFWWVDRYAGLLMKYYADPEQPGRHGHETCTELVFSRDGVDWQRPYRWTDLGAWSYANPFEQAGDLCLVAHHARHLTLFRTRRDGLASCGTDGVGSFCTHPFVMPDAALTLNADCRTGSIAVELLEPRGVVLAGFEADRCRLEGSDGTALALVWGTNHANQYAGSAVRLRFTVRSARLYAVSSSNAE